MALYQGLDYSTQEINRTFKIKVSGIDAQGNKVHKLVGVRGLMQLIGADFTNKFLRKAFNTPQDKLECKLRRGIKVVFYYY